MIWFKYCNKQENILLSEKWLWIFLKENLSYVDRECAKSTGTMVFVSCRLKPHSSNFVSLLEISSQRYPENFKTFGHSVFDFLWECQTN